MLRPSGSQCVCVCAKSCTSGLIWINLFTPGSSQCQVSSSETEVRWFIMLHGWLPHVSLWCCFELKTDFLQILSCIHEHQDTYKSLCAAHGKRKSKSATSNVLKASLISYFCVQWVMWQRLEVVTCSIGCTDGHHLSLQLNKAFFFAFSSLPEKNPDNPHTHYPPNNTHNTDDKLRGLQWWKSWKKSEYWT